MKELSRKKTKGSVGECRDNKILERNRYRKVWSLAPASTPGGLSRRITLAGRLPGGMSGNSAGHSLIEHPSAEGSHDREG